MKIPKTAKGFIALMRSIDENFIAQNLKGFNDLSDKDKEALTLLDADISNYINEVDAFPVKDFPVKTS
jgi:hypothetical protein